MILFKRKKKQVKTKPVKLNGAHAVLLGPLDAFKGFHEVVNNVGSNIGLSHRQQYFEHRLGPQSQQFPANRVAGLWQVVVDRQRHHLLQGLQTAIA
jgi:hypothetical protein